ncbi:MAG TPA: glycosyltransferase [Acetobacteraceae bacterium]|nr:glycosyltransferase [Acetobacteraceae bacterium]
MRIAYIGHAYHEKTGSTRFLIDLLEQHATVERWSGEPGTDPKRGWGATFDETRYDAIVVFQLPEAFDLLSGRHPNVVFVPMYDAIFWGGNLHWRRAYDAAKIACFSWALSRHVARHTQAYANFQYYPDPERYAPVEDFAALRGLLWYRKPEISPALVFELCQGTPFESFVLHDWRDPGNQVEGEWVAPPNIGRLERTVWDAEGAAYAAALNATNVFFAPRRYEGIGVSVLEAMASGHCVAAPDAPTMNEYISHGTNGLLYELERPRPLDFAAAQSLGARARESVERGHRRWTASIPALLEFITTPTARLSERPQWWTPRNTTPVSSAGLVTVVVVGEPAADARESAAGQAGGPVECVASEDTVAAMNAAAAAARGAWLLFLGSGDCFISNDALSRMFARVPPNAEVVYGHHIRRSGDMVRAAAFDASSARLQCGDVGLDWLRGIPVAAATAVRRDLLLRLRLDEDYGPACMQDLLFRAHAQGAKLFNCDEVLLVHDTAVQSGAWLAIIRRYGSPAAADRLQAVLSGAPAPSRTARLGRFALMCLAAIDRYSPRLARAISRNLSNIAAMSVVRRWLRRAGVPQ